MMVYEAHRRPSATMLLRHHHLRRRGPSDASPERAPFSHLFGACRRKWRCLRSPARLGRVAQVKCGLLAEVDQPEAHAGAGLW